MCFGSKSPSVKHASMGSTQTVYDPSMDSARNPRLKNASAASSPMATTIADQAAPTPSMTSPMQ